MNKKFLSAVALALATTLTGGALALELPQELRLTEEGFLPNPGQEYVRKDEYAGQWVYIDNALSIQITRHTSGEPMIWYEADIHASPTEPLYTLVAKANSGKHRLVNPLTLAEENRAVLAITDDFCGYRLHNGKTPGILVRNGVAEGNKTQKNTAARTWPNLDALAVYGDGRMEANPSDAYTAEEYIAGGAVDVFAFGPVLVRQGRMNGLLAEESYYPGKEPRMAVGMIAPYHYIILAVTGRAESSDGARLSWLANRMIDLGVQEALNLDGGNTAAMVFLGDVLNRSPKNMRSVSSMIAFGHLE